MALNKFVNSHWPALEFIHDKPGSGLMEMVLTIIMAWFLADLFSGLVHWVIDRCLDGRSRFSFLNQVNSDNESHHRSPAALTRISLWENINTTAVVTLPVAFLLAIAGAPIVLWLAVFIATFGNAVHRWAHTPKSRLPKVIGFLQRIGVLITAEQHNLHHFDERGIIKKGDARLSFCSLTNYLNLIWNWLAKKPT